MKNSPSKALLLFTVIFMDFLVGMEFDLFVPSFPELQSHFQLTPSWVEASLSVNFIGFCIGLFCVGNMADSLGRRPTILLGLSTFIAGSMLCLWAPAYSYMLVGRFFQGLGIAAPSILSFLLIADAFELKKQQFYLAMLNGVMNIAIAFAPVIGSYVSLYFHWQGNFALLLFMGLFVLAISLLFVPKDTTFVAKENTIGYQEILKAKPLALLITTFIFMFVPWWIFVGISPLLFMESLGVSLSHFGYYQGSMALVFAICSISYGLVMERFDQIKTLYFSNALCALSLVLLIGISLFDCTNPLTISIIFLLFVIATVIPTVVLFPQALNYIPQAKGRTAALIQAGRLILSSFALQLAGYCYTGSFQSLGMIISFFIFLTILALHLVIQKNQVPELQ